MKRVVIVLVGVGISLGGCGKGEPVTPAEKHLAAVTNEGRCSEGRAKSRKETEAHVAEVRAVVRADLKLPRVSKLIADTRAQQRLLAKPATRPVSGYLEKDYEAGVRVYEDEKALGFRCIAPPRKPIHG